MHPRNKYGDGIDFAELAVSDPDFKKFLIGESKLDFHDPNSVRALTKAVLRRDFNLNIELPDDRLCPAIPNRLNYILWLQDLLGETRVRNKDDPIVGLDIGTGASAIYPLLGCSGSNWKFVATEIDDESLKYARSNVEANGLLDRINIFKGDENLIKLGDHENLDFSMCNPPFYSSNEDLLASAKLKSLPPMSACTGSSIEMVTEGGEAAFIQKMVTESLKLGEKVQWYTSMLGKLSSVEKVVNQFKEAKIENFVVAEFVQGVGKTKRWAVGWSFHNMRARDETGRQPRLQKLRHLLPFPTTYRIPISSGVEKRIAIDQVNAVLDDVSLKSWVALSGDDVGHGTASSNTWSRAARRMRQKIEKEGGKLDELNLPDALGLSVGIGDDISDEETHASDDVDGPEADENMEWATDSNQTILKTNKKGKKPADLCVFLHWTKGTDQVLWESFCGMIKRKVTDILGQEKSKGT